MPVNWTPLSDAAFLDGLLLLYSPDTSCIYCAISSRYKYLHAYKHSPHTNIFIHAKAGFSVYVSFLVMLSAHDERHGRIQPCIAGAERGGRAVWCCLLARPSCAPGELRDRGSLVPSPTAKDPTAQTDGRTQNIFRINVTYLASSILRSNKSSNRRRI